MRCLGPQGQNGPTRLIDMGPTEGIVFGHIILLANSGFAVVAAQMGKWVRFLTEEQPECSSS